MSWDAVLFEEGSEGGLTKGLALIEGSVKGLMKENIEFHMWAGIQCDGQRKIITHV